MNPINSNIGIGPEMYALKKAIDIQAEGVMKLLESMTSTSPAPINSSAELTGVGQNLDIRA